MSRNPPYNSIIFAEYLLAVAQQQSKQLDVTQTQKLLYMLYGIYLVKTKKRLLDEMPKAWAYGPVFPNTRKAISYEREFSLDDPRFASIMENELIRNDTEAVVRKYGVWTAGELSRWSHSPDGPWDQTFRKAVSKGDDDISDEVMLSYFEGLFKMSKKVS